MSPLTVTPFFRNPLKFVNASSAPPLSLIVPPITVPACKNHEPVDALSVNPPISVPERSTIDPDRLNVPNCACVNVPLRFTDEFVAVIVPLFATDLNSVRALPVTETVPAL